MHLGLKDCYKIYDEKKKPPAVFKLNEDFRFRLDLHLDFWMSLLLGFASLYLNSAGRKPEYQQLKEFAKIHVQLVLKQQIAFVEVQHQNSIAQLQLVQILQQRVNVPVLPILIRTALVVLIMLFANLQRNVLIRLLQLGSATLMVLREPLLIVFVELDQQQAIKSIVQI